MYGPALRVQCGQLDLFLNSFQRFRRDPPLDDWIAFGARFCPPGFCAASSEFPSRNAADSLIIWPTFRRCPDSAKLRFLNDDKYCTRTSSQGDLGTREGGSSVGPFSNKLREPCKGTSRDPPLLKDALTLPPPNESHNPRSSHSLLFVYERHHRFGFFITHNISRSTPMNLARPSCIRSYRQNHHIRPFTLPDGRSAVYARGCTHPLFRRTSQQCQGYSGLTFDANVLAWPGLRSFFLLDISRANVYAHANGNAKRLLLSRVEGVVTLHVLGVFASVRSIPLWQSRIDGGAAKASACLSAVRVQRVEKDSLLIARMLSEKIGGCNTHYVHNRSRNRAPSHRPSPTYHRSETVWKGYVAAEIWRCATDDWLPVVLELTEHVELDMRDVYARGQLWELRRGQRHREKA